MDEEWFVLAKTLSPEGKARLKCCNSNDTMVVSNNRRGYSAYCFRCGAKYFKSHGQRSISLLAEQRAAEEFKEQGIIALPEDYVSIDFAPEKAMHWVLQYGITLHKARSYHIGYSLAMNRVILPVYQTDELDCLTPELRYIQARAVDENQKPKYLNQEQAARNVIFWSHNLNPSEYVVVTEDILSAIKVGDVNNSCSILGTNMTAQKAMQISQRYDKVILWLDHDEAGINGARQAQRELYMQGIEKVIVIHTLADPKAISHEAIKKIIGEQTNA